MSIQHGLYASVITACMASLMYDAPARPPDLDITEYYLALARLPAQWILVAVILGVYRQSQLRLDQAKDAEIRHLRLVADRFAQEVARLDSDLQQFELATALGSVSGPLHREIRQPP